ncbi:MAG: DUF4038 domain-containing protein [Acidobacteria bacterium]|nr:DUF4038 domain-containing protein [Acidobacteriota bacterium]
MLLAVTGIEQYHSHDFVFRATVAGNPFDVELAGEFQGPAGLRLRVPGFYDGDGTWKIRFSPTRPGEWSLKTVSPVSALDGKTETGILCTPNRHPRIHGGLKVDAAHPRHFLYEDGTRYFLLGYEADWLWGVQMNDPRRASMNRLIGLMASRGFNHVMVNVYAHDTRWAPGKSCEWDYGPPELYAWEGTNDKPDHSRLNVRFFQRYDRMMEALREQGIVAHIMLKVYNKSVNWPAKWSRDEERYFRYVAARYQAFSNVVWDFSKESYNEKDEALQSRLIDLVRSTDAYRRVTTAHDDDAYEWDSELSRNLDFRTDQQHSDYAAMIRFDRARRQYPVLNSEFGYEYGVEKLPTHTHRNQCDWQEHLRRAYLIYLAGGYGVYYYNNTAWDVVKPDPEPPGMRRFQLLKDTLSALPYWKMSPHNELAVGGLCLALSGTAYAFYVEGAGLTANLTALEHGVTAEWIDTWTGAREAASVRPGVQRLSKPASFGKAPGLLIISSRSVPGT